MSHESRGLPDVVGLCPRHFLEFYVPHDGTCPYGDCGEQLVVYRLPDANSMAEKLASAPETKLELGADHDLFGSDEELRAFLEATGNPQES